MSLTDNTTELKEVLTLAEAIEVPTIKSISVNGVEQEPDENKNVDIEVPSASITAITVNGVEQTPEEGTVNIAAVPPITEYADWVAELRTQCYTKGEPTVPPAVETVQTTMANVAYAIARRGANGTLNVGTPTGSAHATTKEYVDNVARILATCLEGKTTVAKLDDGSTSTNLTWTAGDQYFIRTTSGSLKIVINDTTYYSPLGAAFYFYDSGSTYQPYGMSVILNNKTESMSLASVPTITISNSSGNPYKVTTNTF